MRTSVESPELTHEFRVVEVVRRQVGRGRAGEYVYAPAYHGVDVAHFLLQSSQTAQGVGIGFRAASLRLGFRLFDHSAGALFCVAEDGHGPLLGLKHQFVLVEPFPVIVFRRRLGAAGFGLGQVKDVVLLSQNFLGCPNFLRNGQPKLVNQLYCLGAVNHDVTAGAGCLAGVNESLQLVDDIYNIYDSPLSRSLPFDDRISEFRV